MTLNLGSQYDDHRSTEILETVPSDHHTTLTDSHPLTPRRTMPTFPGLHISIHQAQANEDLMNEREVKSSTSRLQNAPLPHRTESTSNERRRLNETTLKIWASSGFTSREDSCLNAAGAANREVYVGWRIRAHIHPSVVWEVQGRVCLCMVGFAFDAATMLVAVSSLVCRGACPSLTDYTLRGVPIYHT